MSLIPKHFGLKSKEESYIFKELDKIQRKTKKDFQLLKQRLLAKPTLDDGIFDWESRATPAPSPEKGRVSVRGPAPRKKPLSKKGHAVVRFDTSQILPRLPGLGEAVPSKKKARHFQPQSFYRRSSAFLRSRCPKGPPVIAPQVGTTKPAVLQPPPAPRAKPKARRVALIRGTAASRRPSGELSQEEADRDAAQLSEDKRASLTSTGDEDDGSRTRRSVRIRTHFKRKLSESSSSVESLPSIAPSTPRSSLRSTPRSSLRPSPRSSLRPSARSSLRPSWLPHRVIPASIEDIIASLQSETQLAMDQHIKELIQSVLGQNYDIRMEEFSLMEKMRAKSSETEIEPPQKEAELESEISAEETEKLTEGFELTEVMSSIFPSDQEYTDWTVMDRETSEVKVQTIPESHTEEESQRTLEESHTEADIATSKKMPLKVGSSEFLQVKGREIKRIQKTEVEIPPVRPRKFLKPRWRRYRLTKTMSQAFIPHHIHDLCSTTPTQELPVDLFLASRVLHTSDKISHKNMLSDIGLSFLDDRYTDEQRERILRGIPVTEENEEDIDISLTVLKKFLEPEPSWHAEESQLQLQGEEVSAYPGSTKPFWNPAAPKFGVPESVVKDVLYPKYESVRLSTLLTRELFESKDSITLLESVRKESVKSFILRKAASYENVRKPLISKWIYYKRAKSAPDLQKEVAQLLIIKDDTRSNMIELRLQQIKAHKTDLLKQETVVISEKESREDNADNMKDKERSSVFLIEASKKAGINYIVFPKEKKLKSKKGLTGSKLALVYSELAKPPLKLERPLSHGILPGQKKFFLKVPVYELPIRSPSLPSFSDYDKYIEMKGGPEKFGDPQKWLIDTLNKAQQQKERVSDVKADVPKNLLENVVEPQKLELSDDLQCDLSQEVIQYYTSEVEILTEEINRKKACHAFAYCRRGAIYRKLGMLKSAMSDLQQAIYLEPMFLNAYWHRHFIFLFQDKIAEAMDDLNYIHKYNKNNAEAYLSKAEIFKTKNDLTLAILNYTQALKCKPRDPDIYFRRGEVYEKTNRVLAIDDYSKCIAFDPKRMDALMKRGVFHFENENWNAAIVDFTALLNVDHLNAQAR